MEKQPISTMQINRRRFKKIPIVAAIKIEIKTEEKYKKRSDFVSVVETPILIKGSIETSQKPKIKRIKLAISR